MVVQGIKMYMQELQMQARTTGQQPQIDPKQLMQVVQTFLQEMATQPPKEVIKERQKQAAKVQA